MKIFYTIKEILDTKKGYISGDGIFMNNGCGYNMEYYKTIEGKRRDKMMIPRGVRNGWKDFLKHNIKQPGKK